MSERTDADKLAKRLLEEPNADPDDDLRLLARQLLRRNETIDKLTGELQAMQDPTLDMIQANIEITLGKYRDAATLIVNVLVGGGCKNDAEKLVYIGRVLFAVNTFHPMHGESWCGWPEKSNG